MLAVALPTTPTATSPTPPTMSSSGSLTSHTSSTPTMARKPSGSTSMGYRPPVPSRASSSSSSVHFQHQIPPTRAHVNGHGSSSSSTAPAHPHSLAQASSSSSPQVPAPRRAATPPTPPPPDSDSQPAPTIDISAYSSTDLLKLLASLLTQIAATNDSLSSSSSPVHTASLTSPQIHSPIWSTLTSASRHALSTSASTLTFHARNIPTISLESYFLRILKYCPTTNHVFLSLLVYFDRMAKMSLESTGRAFVIDSYNVHRLVIAGVTVASKFFSDVFYTNSRYAKVGGLPLPELNQLELQFLLLNDFRLVINGDEMQRYAEQLILFSKTNSAGKEKDLPRDAKEDSIPSTHRPIVMQRRDSSNAYSSFPSAASASSSSSTSTAMGHTSSRPASGSYTAYQAPIPHVSHPAFQPSSTSTRSTTLPETAAAVPAAPSHSRTGTFPSAAPAHPPRRTAPSVVANTPVVQRRTPPIHVNASRNGGASANGPGRMYRTGTNSDDDEDDDEDEEGFDESDDYDSDEDDSQLPPHMRRRRRHRRRGVDTETETETDAGETTDGGSGSTTSDEPTVRPAGAGRRRSMSMSTSTSSFGGDDEGDGANGPRGAGQGRMDVESGAGDAEGEGEGTPELRKAVHSTPRGEGPEHPMGDVRMGSPRG